MLIYPSGYWESQGEKGEKKEINNTTLTMQESLEMLRGDGDANPTVRFGRIDELLRRHRRRGDTGRRGDNFRPLDDLSSTIGKPSVNLKGSPILWVCSVLVSLCLLPSLSFPRPALCGWIPSGGPSRLMAIVSVRETLSLSLSLVRGGPTESIKLGARDV